MALQGLLRHPSLGTALAEYVKTWFDDPGAMCKEHSKFLSRWLLGKEEKPQEGLRFEHHSHSHFSDGAELADIVDLLFERGIGLWSLTDHQNSAAFDSLVSGAYRLRGEYEIESGSDPRHLVINRCNQCLVMLRSTELMTEQGEIGVHGYDGTFPDEPLELTEAIHRATDMGGYVVINHPYFVNLSIGYHGNELIGQAAEAGAIAIEKNGLEIPPLIYSPVRAERDAERYGLALVTSGDAHSLETYGKSGIAFNEDAYLAMLIAANGRHADAIRELISAEAFECYLNYPTPPEFIRCAAGMH